MNKCTKIKIWAFCMRLGNRGGCHQKKDRSFFISGYQFPVCSRCTGILSGQIIGILLYINGIRIYFLLNFLLLFIMFIDWFIQYKEIKPSTNIRRFITGNMAGVAEINVILFIFNMLYSFMKSKSRHL
jgi:uncharacterized membrane protein